MLSAGITFDGSIDGNRDGIISQDEFDAASRQIEQKFNDGATTVNVNGMELTRQEWQDWQSRLQNLYISESGAAQPPTPGHLSNAQAAVEETYRDLLSAEQILNDLQNDPDATPEQIAEAQAVAPLCPESPGTAPPAWVSRNRAARQLAEGRKAPNHASNPPFLSPTARTSVTCAQPWQVRVQAPPDHFRRRPPGRRYALGLLLGAPRAILGQHVAE